MASDKPPSKAHQASTRGAARRKTGDPPERLLLTNSRYLPKRHKSHRPTQPLVRIQPLRASKALHDKFILQSRPSRPIPVRQRADVNRR